MDSPLSHMLDPVPVPAHPGCKLHVAPTSASLAWAPHVAWDPDWLEQVLCAVQSYTSWIGFSMRGTRRPLPPCRIQHLLQPLWDLHCTWCMSQSGQCGWFECMGRGDGAVPQLALHRCFLQCRSWSKCWVLPVDQIKTQSQHQALDDVAPWAVSLKPLIHFDYLILNFRITLRCSVL